MQFSLQIRLLGVVQISQNEQLVTGFESRKALALLCYLISDQRPIARNQLVDLFWGDKSETRGKGNLSRVLNNINRVLPDCLEANRQTVRFVPPPALWLDIEIFDQLYRDKTIASWNAAASLYQGTFLQDLYLDDSPSFELWLVSQQEHWQQRLAQVLNGLTAYYLQNDEYQKGLDTSEQLLNINPWREEAHRLKMLFLALNEQRSDAIVQYQECQRVLEQELQVAPSEMTQALYQAIAAEGQTELLAQWKNRLFQPQNLVFLNHNLPATTTPFFGRTQELSDLTKRLTATGDQRLLTLVGLGGMGKTRLALEAAGRMIHHFTDGVFFVPLDLVRTQEGMLVEISQALKLFSTRQQQLQQQLLNLLRDKQMLLILDSFEHLIDETALLLTLLKEAPHLYLLVTSRQRLKLPSEQVFEINGLSVHSPQPNTPTALAPAMELFLESARRAGSMLEKEDHPIIQVICEKLDGMPLGLELAAPWTRTVPCTTIADEIDKNLEFLANTTVQDTNRHQSIHAAFEHSWQLLTDAEKTTFIKLSVFKGGFTLEAFAEVVNSSWHMLSSLQDKSLIHRTSSHRFSLHGLLCQLGTERLEKRSALKRDIYDRYCKYFMAFAHQKGQQLQGEGQFAALSAIGQELENILAAWNWALQQRLDDLLIKAYYPLSRFFELNSRFQEGLAWFDGTITALEKTVPDSSLLPQLLIFQGTLLLRQGNYEQSETSLEQGLSRLDAADILNRACALEALGETYYFKGKNEQAKAFLEEGLSLFETLDSAWGIANGKNNLGNLYWRQGDYQKARQLHQEALVLRQQTKDDWGKASSLNNLGAVAYHLEDYPAAQHYFEQGLETGKQIGDHLNVAACLNNLGEVARRLNQMDRAKQFHQDSLKLRQAIGDRIGIAYSFNNLGDTSLALGEVKEAFAFFQNALQRAMEVEAFPAAIYIMVGVARCFAQQRAWETCAKLVGFIMNHPEKGNDVEMRIQPLLDQLQSEIPERNLQPWFKYWEKQSIEKMVVKIQQLTLN